MYRVSTICATRAHGSADRVFGYEPKGPGFESLWARHKTTKNAGFRVFYLTNFRKLTDELTDRFWFDELV